MIAIGRIVILFYQSKWGVTDYHRKKIVMALQETKTYSTSFTNETL